MSWLHSPENPLCDDSWTWFATNYGPRNSWMLPRMTHVQSIYGKRESRVGHKMFIYSCIFKDLSVFYLKGRFTDRKPHTEREIEQERHRIPHLLVYSPNASNGWSSCKARSQELILGLLYGSGILRTWAILHPIPYVTSHMECCCCRLRISWLGHGTSPRQCFLKPY